MSARFNDSRSMVCSLIVVVLLFCGRVTAEEFSSSVLEFNRAVLLDDAQVDNVWLKYDYFHPKMDIFDYAGSTKTSNTLDKWSNIHVGLNTGISEQFRLRLQAEKGSQKLSRPREPKSLNPGFWGGEIRLQWRSQPTDSFRWGLEAGYRAHHSPVEGVEKLEEGGITATAAPGKMLFESSAKDAAWLAGVGTSFDVSEALSLHAHFEYRAVQVQAITTSYDPLILAVLQKRQIPQTTPWHEKHMVSAVGLDWRFFERAFLALDVRHYLIRRSNYIPRTGFRDYNESAYADIYLGYAITPDVTLMTHAQVGSNYFLGDLPLLYNRRNNHTFNHPFATVSAGLNYSF